MGGGEHGVGMDFRAGHRQETLYTPPPPGETLPEAEARIRANAERLGLPLAPRPATLDTPERREYEEAKKSGRTVPAVDPFANASPAQRERMEEQRAFLLAQGRGRAVHPDLSVSRETIEDIRQAEEAQQAEAAVRTEPLDTLSDGTTPLAGDADEEVHFDG